MDISKLKTRGSRIRITDRTRKQFDWCFKSDIVKYCDIHPRLDVMAHRVDVHKANLKMMGFDNFQHWLEDPQHAAAQWMLYASYL